MEWFQNVTNVPKTRTTPISFPELPQMNGGKGRTEYLNASHLRLSENVGLPIAGLLEKERILYGNGVTIVPNVHAVIAWAASEGHGPRNKRQRMP